ncbi:RagB/SusD family nutrient uptake outer membrane protein [Sphingobacterium daejeonense]|nr:RagB/SusD family nutrient uptake outer membrane protein [Sphingobacterium daejeonense]MCT1529599.1 RagB/SusD family nutrient uptake outer membrane protein [Sphingobacterium daejeonense]
MNLKEIKGIEINWREFNERMYFFPIPIEDLVLNKNLEQNPGWETGK